MNYLSIYFDGSSGMYCPEHIIYLIVSTLVMVVSIILIKKFVKHEDTLDYIIKIFGLLGFICIFLNRFSITYRYICILEDTDKTWFSILPQTLCSTTSLVISLAMLFGKKDNRVIHGISYIAFFGGIAVMLYPNFLDSQTFCDVRSFTGLLHHSVTLYNIVLMVATGWMRPTLKKWYCVPISICAIMTYGLFCLEIFGGNPMYIQDPMVKSYPILSSWYVVLTIVFILSLLIELLFDKVIYKNKKEKEL